MNRNSYEGKLKKSVGKSTREKIHNSINFYAKPINEVDSSALAKLHTPYLVGVKG